MEGLISSFQATSYPPFPSLSSLILSLSNNPQDSLQYIQQAQKSDLSTQIKFFLQLLWDLAEFLAINESYNVANLQEVLKISWISLYSDHPAINDTLITAIVCDLFSNNNNNNNDKSKEIQHLFFNLCFVIPSENPGTSKNCGKLLASFVSLVVSIGGEEGKGVKRILDESARWIQEGSTPLKIFPQSFSPSPSPSALLSLSELLRHHVVLSQSPSLARLNFISFVFLFSFFPFYFVFSFIFLSFFVSFFLSFFLFFFLYYNILTYMQTSPNFAHVILSLSIPHLLPITPDLPQTSPHILSSLNPSQQASLAHIFTHWLTSTPSLLLSPSSSSSLSRDNTLISAALCFSVSQPIRDINSFYLSPATAAHAALMHVLWESPSHPSLSPSVLLPSIHALAASVVAETNDGKARECAADRFAQVIQMVGGKGNKQEREACISMLQPLPSTLLVSTVRQHLLNIPA